jgi:hypothetical protein
MRRALLSLGAGALPWAPLLVLWACGGGSNQQPPATVDASDAGDAGAGDEFSVPDVPFPEGGQSCTIGLPGMTSDPVALCFQGDLLTAEITQAYVKGQGVAQTWDDSGHTSGHTWQDDVGLASAIAGFDCSAEYYGNAGYALLDTTLGDLGLVFEKELVTVPPGYDGEIYFRLRNAEAGYNYLNDAKHASLLRGVADAYGRALQTTYAQIVPAAGDGGSSGVVLGTPDAGGGFDYAPAQVIMGAAALLDMAFLHAGDDGGADAAAWQATALAALDYVWRRGRDPVTGLFYPSLVTSADLDHDALAPSGTPAPDALLTDVQATVVLGLTRVQDRLDALAAADASTGVADGGVAGDYLGEADAIVQALLGGSGAALWDGSSSPVLTPGAFLEGVVPSQAGALLTNKTTLSTSFLLGGIHRLIVSRGSTAGFVLGQLRAALLQATPAHSSLFTVLTDANGFALQDGFLRASSRDWNYATALGPGAERGAAEETGARAYRADANHAVAEGLDQLWRTATSGPLCAP